MEFSKRLMLLRQKLGLSQEELAKRLGVSRSAVSLWELGKRSPDIPTINLLADFFDVTTDYLLGRDKPLVNDSISAHFEGRMGADLSVLEEIFRDAERKAKAWHEEWERKHGKKGKK